MVGIKEYLLLREIEMFLENEIDYQLKENNGFSNKPIENIKKMKNDLTKFLNKLVED